MHTDTGWAQMHAFKSRGTKHDARANVLAPMEQREREADSGWWGVARRVLNVNVLIL